MTRPFAGFPTSSEPAGASRITAEPTDIFDLRPMDTPERRSRLSPHSSIAQTGPTEHRGVGREHGVIPTDRFVPHRGVDVHATFCPTTARAPTMAKGQSMLPCPECAELATYAV